MADPRGQEAEPFVTAFGRFNSTAGKKAVREKKFDMGTYSDQAHKNTALMRRTRLGRLTAGMQLTGGLARRSVDRKARGGMVERTRTGSLRACFSWATSGAAKTSRCSRRRGACVGGDFLGEPCVRTDVDIRSRKTQK